MGSFIKGDIVLKGMIGQWLHKANKGQLSVKIGANKTRRVLEK